MKDTQPKCCEKQKEINLNETNYNDTHSLERVLSVGLQVLISYCICLIIIMKQNHKTLKHSKFDFFSLNVNIFIRLLIRTLVYYSLSDRSISNLTNYMLSKTSVIKFSLILHLYCNLTQVTKLCIKLFHVRLCMREMSILHDSRTLHR